MLFKVRLDFLNINTDADNTAFDMFESDKITLTRSEQGVSFDTKGDFDLFKQVEDAFSEYMLDNKQLHAKLTLICLGYDHYITHEICIEEGIQKRTDYSYIKGLIELEGKDVEALYQEWFSNNIMFCSEIPEDDVEESLSFEAFVSQCIFEHT